jgi:hypothetical protein
MVSLSEKSVEEGEREEVGLPFERKVKQSFWKTASIAAGSMVRAGSDTVNGGEGDARKEGTARGNERRTVSTRNNQ